MTEHIHTSHNRPRHWRVCRIVSLDPVVLSPIEGLDHLPEPLAQAICVALEEAKPDTYFIEGLVERDE